MSGYQLVTEAGLGRILGKYFDIGFIIISAERSCEAEKGQKCSEAEELEQQIKPLIFCILNFLILDKEEKNFAVTQIGAKLTMYELFSNL